MNIIYRFWIIGIITLFASASIVSCNSDDDIQDDATKVSRLEVQGATDALIELEVADEYPVQVNLLPEDAVDREEYSYVYSSSNEDIFRVSEEGVITALSEGEAALRIDPVNNTDLWAIVTIRVKSKLFLVESIDIPEQYKDFYIGVDKSVSLPELITLTPEYATNQDLIYSSDNTSVATVTRRGVITTLGLGDATITMKADDGSNTEAAINLHVRNSSYQDLGREGWTVTTSHQYFADATVVGSPESLIDASDAYGTNENEPTCLCLVKPGKSLGGVSVGAGEKVYFIIDMQKEEEFSGFRLRHRIRNNSAFLRLMEASAYGSNNGTDFELIKDGITIDVEENEVTIDLPTTVEYRYFKLTYDKWHSTGSTVQISDFNIVKLIYQDL